MHQKNSFTSFKPPLNLNKRPEKEDQMKYVNFNFSIFDNEENLKQGKGTHLTYRGKIYPLKVIVAILSTIASIITIICAAYKYFN